MYTISCDIKFKAGSGAIRIWSRVDRGDFKAGAEFRVSAAVHVIRRAQTPRCRSVIKCTWAPHASVITQYHGMARQRSCRSVIVNTILNVNT